MKNTPRLPREMHMTEHSSTQEKQARDNQFDTTELLLREYEEIGQCWRHDDQVASQLTGMLFPLAVGAFVLPFAYPNLERLSLALGGTLMMLFWLLYYLRLQPKHALRFRRAKEIERILGLNHHRQFDEVGLRTRLPSITQLRVGIFVIYCLSWVVLLLIP
jgi:hypothetical protein